MHVALPPLFPLPAGSLREGAPGFRTAGGEFTRRALPTAQPLPKRLLWLATSQVLTHQPDAHLGGLGRQDLRDGQDFAAWF